MHRLLPIPMVLAIAAFASTLDANAESCTLIKNVNQLQRIQDNLAGSYCLANDIDAAGHRGFVPIGGTGGAFTGKLNGRGFTISNLKIRSAASQVGLFGNTIGATIHDVTLQNISVSSTADNATAGGLVGSLLANPGTDTGAANIRVSGKVTCTGAACRAGGIAGGAANVTIRDSSSSADVSGTQFVGGAVGIMQDAAIKRSYTTGAVACTGLDCMAGGLLGRVASSTVTLAFATGPVSAADGLDSRAGGLIGYGEAAMAISLAHAAGPVTGGATGFAAAFMAQLNGGSADQTYAVGRVSSSGATIRGWAVSVATGVVVTNAYWDTDTTGQATSAAGTGQTTAQLRTALPVGFDPTKWGITPNLSYPFLLQPSIDLVSPLATLVRSNKVFTFLPISQRDDAQYRTPPAHADEASLATVFTMIARAIGITENVEKLENVPIDKYFWDDSTQQTKWRGPVQDYAKRGPRAAIAAGAPLDAGNVIGAMDLEQLVILRGTFNDGGTTAQHWMLGTLYAKDAGGDVVGVLAHDPWTGRQVVIDPITKSVVSPPDFPLDNFKVNGFQPVTVN